MRLSRLQSFFLILILATSTFFFSWFVLNKAGINDLPIQSEDTLPAMFLPFSILDEGTLYLDSYYDQLLSRYPHPDDKSYTRGLVPFYLRKVPSANPESTHYVSAFTIVTPLLALPIYFFPVVLGIAPTWENVTIFSHLASAYIVGLSGSVLYLFLRDTFFSQDEEKPLLKQSSLLLTALYLFATINYAHISQALWQHGTVQLFTILALWAFYEKKHLLLGLFFGLMLLSRPTSGIAVVLIGLLALIENRGAFKRFFPRVVLGFLPAVAFFLWYNGAFYGDISNQGYAGQIFTEWKGRFPEGFLGLWLSPSKGILIYSPVFVFSLVGTWLSAKNWRKNLDYIVFALIVLIHTLVLGKWKHWYGGWSFGYRMASDILPFLVLLVVPFLKSPLYSRFKNAFFALFAVSLAWQLYGIVFYDGIWHSAYDLGYQDTSWLWSLRNSELVFNIRRTLVKLGLRESPF